MVDVVIKPKIKKEVNKMSLKDKLKKLRDTSNEGSLIDLEVDFVAQKSGETLYIQVAYLLPTKETRDREFGNLLKISDNLRKIVVSMDEFAQGNVDGIEHLHILDFLKI